MNTVAPMLEVSGLKIVMPSGHNLVDDVSFQIEHGGFHALVGESGSGKTVTARSILQLLPPGLSVSAGRVLLNGEDVLQADHERMRKLRGGTIGMVFQEPMVSLNPAIRIRDQMMEGLSLHRRGDPKSQRRACLDMLERVQIADPLRCMNAFPHEFSGGMRQRVMLASVMLLKPSLLIADEPTTALDTLSQLEVMNIMSALAKDEGTAVLLITHNLGLVSRYASHASVMRQGKIVEHDDRVHFLGEPRFG